MIETFFSLLILLSILLISVFIANQIKPIPVSQVKYTSIEGLRGYLAFFVFIHHSYIWFSYIKTNTWEAPQSNLFNSFGQSSVLFFFMITSFLFTTKILESTPTINWKKLFISRFFRLVPMYFFSMVLFMIIVIIKSNGTINDSISSIIKNVITWFTFTISGNPNINNVKDTYLINAGVAWSLPYEWIFYFMLPLLGILFKVKTSIKTIIISTAIVVLFIVLNKSRLNYFFPFLSGILIAIFAKKIKNPSLFKKPIFSLFIIVGIILNTYFFHDNYKIVPLLIFTFIFFLIVLNNSFFGLLHLPISKKLGQITYSFYLIHGIVLYVLFHFLYKIENIEEYDYYSHLKLISICVFPITIISHLTYCYIEKPFIKFSTVFTAKYYL